MRIHQNKIGNQMQHLKKYVQRRIRTSDSNQTPINVVHLKNDKCVVVYLRSCVVTNLLSGKQQGHADFKDRILDVFPYRNGFFVHTTEFLYVDEDYKVNPVPMNVQTRKAQFMFFSQSQELYEYYCQGVAHCMTNMQSKNILYADLYYDSDDTYHVSADQTQTLIALNSSGRILLYDIKLQNQRRIHLPFKDKVQNFYLVEENRAICTRSSGDKISIWTTNFGKDASCYEHRSIPPTPYIRFCSINIEHKLLLFATSTEAIVYNYEKQTIIGRFKSTSSQIQRQVSPDFLNFVQIDSASNEGQIVHYKFVGSFKKLLMHLVKSSGVERMYGGDGLVRRMLGMMQLK